MVFDAVFGAVGLGLLWAGLAVADWAGNHGDTILGLWASLLLIVLAMFALMSIVLWVPTT